MKYFFCFGMPKSGTSFLQMLINSHPQLSCPAEHRLNNLLNQLPNILTKYNEDLIYVNKVTTNRDLVMLNSEDLNLWAKFIVERALVRGANNRKVKFNGIKDNGLIKNIDFYINNFFDEKYIYLIRDPRQVGVSTWHNNIRLDKKFQNGKDIDSWTINISKNWSSDISLIKKILKEKKLNIMIFKYEELISDSKELRKIFNFLGVDKSKKIISEIFKMNSFERMKDNKFFRKASSNEWKLVLKKETNNLIFSQNKKYMIEFHYSN